MADESTADEAQVTFNIKSSNESKYVITVPQSMSVLDLKNKLATSEYANIPASRQRLIYSGRVLKDTETVGSYKIKDGNTVHLVKGADSNARQNPSDQGGAAAGSNPTNPASNVPQNIAAGTGAHNPLAGLTGARYAGFGQLPGMDMFGADGGMGAPPDPDQLLRMLDNPNFAQQMNEAMNNPAVIDMMRNSPMMQNNPMARQVLENPELRRAMFNPEFIRAQLQLQRQMGGGPFGGAGAGFPAPGNTDTTPGQNAAGDNNTQQQANPFAALFGGNPGAAQGVTPTATPPLGSTGQATPAATTESTNTSTNTTQQPANPFANLFNILNPSAGGGNSDPLAEMTRQMMQNPEAMRAAMQMMGGNGGGGDMLNNPFMFGGGGMGQQTQQPADDRPPEERYSEQLRQLNEMGFYEFDRNVTALRRSGGSVQGAIEMLLNGSV